MAWWNPSAVDFVVLVDRVGSAVGTAERAQIDHAGVSGPDERVRWKRCRILTVADDAPVAVDSGSVGRRAAKRPEVDPAVRRGPRNARGKAAVNVVPAT